MLRGREDKEVSGEQGGQLTSQICRVIDDETGGAGEMLRNRLLVASDHVHHVDAGGVPVRVEQQVVEHHQTVHVEQRALQE